jgi:glycosyltransferase involved in cell wall biosynthesis
VPEVTVAVASHDRPVRLRWLLNALEEQTFPREGFEVVVCHDSGDETETLLRDHPLGVRRHRLPGGGNPPGRQRNVAWRDGSGPLVVFVDDDCRPHPGWLEALVARAAPATVVQGRTLPDPDEIDLLHRAPHARSQEIEPPTPWGQACNIAYPRALLERAGGFDERLFTGEDTDLLQRALEAGARQVAAPEALVWHAVEPATLLGRARSLWRWQDVAGTIKRHPALRARLPVGGLFWKPRHVGLALAAAGLASRRRSLALAGAANYARVAAPSYGTSPRGLLRAATELPGRAVLDAVEVAALARGSLRHRTFFL